MYWAAPSDNMNVRQVEDGVQCKVMLTFSESRLENQIILWERSQRINLLTAASIMILSPWIVSHLGRVVHLQNALYYV